MNLRWPLISSLTALAAGILVAALVVAFCGDNGDGPQGLTSRTTPTATGTTTRTPRAGSPVATGTPDGTPSALTPSVGTPADGEVPVDESPEPPPPEEPPPPGPESTLPPGETPPPPLPTQAAGTASPVPPTGTPRPTATPTPAALPDLVVRDLRVSNDRLVIEIANVGEGAMPAGQEIEFQVRGTVVDTLTLIQPLLSGASVSTVLEDQLIYGTELVLAVVDPNDVIPEEEDLNNGFSKELRPDVPLDFAVVEILAVGPEQRLAVRVRNTTGVPVLGADIRLTVFRDGMPDATAVARQTLDMGPFETIQIDVTQQIAVGGHSFRVVMDVMNLPDANPSNNALEASIP